MLAEIFSILSHESFGTIIFRPTEIDFRFKEITPSFSTFKQLLTDRELLKEESGKILTSEIFSKKDKIRIFASYESLFHELYLDYNADESILVIDPLENDFFYFDHLSGKSTSIESGIVSENYYLENYRLYLPLLKLFRENRAITEFDDTILKRLMIVENGKDKNLVSINYNIFDKRVFSKRVDFNFSELEKWIGQQNQPNHQEWISSFKHNIVFFISAQTLENRSFVELFLNLPFLIANTIRDYNIFISGFSFEKISRELKQEKSRYFADLNQAQDKIKAQVIAVPLSIGTSIYAFFQIKADPRTFYFILAMVGIYIIFICWYLFLYDRDLRKLKSDILEETDKFQTKFPGVYDLFKYDFKYINKKIVSVLWLSWVIKITILADWVILLVYILVVVKHPAQPEAPYHFRFL